MQREITLRDYLRVAWSGRWLILAAAVAGLVVGALLSVARAPQFTATARVYLGQATTISGVPVQTPYTNPTVAPLALDNDAIVRAVADGTRLTPARVRAAVRLSAPRLTGTAGNLPTILTITSTDRNRRAAVDIANAYADGVLKAAGAAYTDTRRVYEQNAARTDEEVRALVADARGLRQKLLTAADGQATLYAVALSSTVNQLKDARKEADDQAVLLRKSEQIEAPQSLTRAERASSSGAAPKRLQSIVLATIIGLLVGILATFVWRGSPAVRAADAGAR